MNRQWLAWLVGLVLLVMGVWGLGMGSGAAKAQSDGTTMRVSVASDGTQGNGISVDSAISGDGRFVTFSSYAGNLVPADTNGGIDVFVHDRQTGETTRISVASDGTQGNDVSYAPAISADGRFVAFESLASNLVPADTNGGIDVFVHDRQTGETTRISVASDGTQGNIDEDYLGRGPAISADGRFVAFNSGSSNLVANDTNDWEDVFVHDRQTGETTRISVASDGTQGNDVSYAPAISADGRFVAFESLANLIPDDTIWWGEIFVHDRQTGETTRISVASDGTQGNSNSHWPAISADGRFVAFDSGSSNLVANDTNGWEDVFVHDRQTGETTRISIASDGAQGNNRSNSSAISADGRFVAFASFASNLVSGDTNGKVDIFIHDHQIRTAVRVSLSGGGVQGNDVSTYPAVSAGGRFIVFTSYADNLVPDDSNNVADVFVHDREGIITPTQKVAVLVHGWQGLAFDALPYKYRCSDWDGGPIEYTSGTTEFGNLAQTLKNEGYRVYLAHWTTGPIRTIRAEQAAECLHQQIQKVKTATGVSQVTLVAHSMGGLVSRAYIENSTIYQGDIERLITFGTPHVGINLAFLVKLLTSLNPAGDTVQDAFCTINPGTCQLSTEEVLLFNLAYRPSSTIHYDFVGGDGGANGPWLWAWDRGLRVTEGPHDGIIGRRSAAGLERITGIPVVTGSNIERWRTGESHTGDEPDKGLVFRHGRIDK